MNAQERIEAAIAARDKATPGPLEVVFKGAIDKYTVEKQEGGIHKQLAYCGYSDALLFAAAPDLVDEVVRLRVWQSEVLPWLEEGRVPLLEQIEMWSGRSREEMYRNQLGELDRLIAEAQEER